MLSRMIQSHDAIIAAGFQSKLAPPGEADSGKAFRLTGDVARVEWINPFSYLYVASKDPGTNSVTNYVFETGHPADLVQSGWLQDTIKTGMTVSVTGTLNSDK